MSPQIEAAVAVLKDGGVIAYPTEYCYGLGCDPRDSSALKRVLQIKRRPVEPGLILIAGDYQHIDQYADLDTAAMLDEIRASWPGPTTWLLPVKGVLPKLLIGAHKTIAMRLSAHPVCQAICDNFAGAVVSTSANRHGEPVLMSAAEVRLEMANEVDMIIDAPLGGANQPSRIRRADNGGQLR